MKNTKKMFAGLLSLIFLMGADYYEIIQLPVVTTLAGTGSFGYSDYGMGQFNLPMGVFSGEDGELYVLDTYNNLIRAISPDGEVQRIAGDILVMDTMRQPQGFYRGGDLEQALFNRPISGVRDSEGRIFIADSANHVIRMIDGDRIYVFAGGGTEGGEYGHDDAQSIEALFHFPTGLAIDADGYLYVADTGNNAIRRIDTYGNVTTVAEDSDLFNMPMGIAVREDGAILVANTSSHNIIIIEDGEARPFAGRFDSPEPSAGLIDGSPKEAMFNLPMGLAFHGENLIVADSGNHAIRAVLPSGEVVTIAGNGIADNVNGSLEEALFHFPRGVYVVDDRIIIADTGNNSIRQIFLPILPHSPHSP